MKYILYFVQSLILIAITPLFIGVIKNLKARIRGYRGVTVLQPYFELVKLFYKCSIISEKSSFITLVGPVLSLGAAISSAFLLPVFYSEGNGIFGNLFIIIFMLGIVKFLSSLLGLDSASTFGGMGSSREMFISMFAEPVMFIIIAFLYMETKSFNIFNIAIINSETLKYNMPHIIGAMGFAVLIAVENARMPVDNPETHLELTMIHEAMVLDISGKELALMELSSYIKFMVFITIFINCFFPAGISQDINLYHLAFSFVIYILKVLGILSVIAVIESAMSKFRLFRVPELISAAFSLSLVAIVINYF
ncbi:MAG: respiratory chain complex I subunit 1 family protein [Solirubrobacterales bacterium]